MTKPRRTQSQERHKAPRAAKPEAPFARSPFAREEKRGIEKPLARNPPVKTPREKTAALPAPARTVLVKESAAPPAVAGLGAMVNRRASNRLRSGHVWVYASDVEGMNLPEGEAPRLVPVADDRGLLLGTALYSPASQIALRLVTREAIGEAEWLKLIEARLRRAIEDRGPRLRDSESGSDSCRLCFSEADELPGIVIDKYGPLVVLQLLNKGVDSAAVREVCVGVLREMLEPAAIVERPDPRMRELEGLSAPATAPLWVREGVDSPGKAEFRLNGLRFHFDADAGQKTGAFLDQSVNYKAAQEFAWLMTPGGRALDVCCYQGGFALHLARVCGRVTGIDASHASLEVAEKNLAANRDQIGAEVDWVAGDAFTVLRDWADANEKFDAIVLDPPAFAKTQRAVEGALRGYKELNLRAFKMLRPGGLLVTCTCSHHVGWAEFEGAVASAAADAHRRVRVQSRRGAAPDHPVILNIPETEYLKCLVLEAQ